MSWDPYAILGVSRTASAEEVRRAYRKLAKELHPDVRPNDRVAEERFKRATAAFNLLSDPALKSRFDRGEIDADGNERMGFGSTRTHSRASAQAGAGAEAPFDLGDIFSDLFGSSAGMAGGPRGFGRMRGRDIRIQQEIDFIDAAVGGRRRVQLADGRTLDIAIPAGIEHGQVLRLKSQGGPGVQGGPPGDALVEVKVRPHPFFRREGNDILMDLPISLTEAVEGARIQAPTVSGPVQLTVPAGANTGMVLRLKGKGVNGGDQLVKLILSVPDTADDELKKFVKKWAKREQKPPRPHG
ncbi:MAG: DnaJ C-terminal domain-containing protein [Hyphomonadaceae bacterium]